MKVKAFGLVRSMVETASLILVLAATSTLCMAQDNSFYVLLPESYPDREGLE